MHSPPAQNQIILQLSPQASALASYPHAQLLVGGGPGATPEPSEPPSIDFSGMWQALLRRWQWIFLVTLMTIGLAVVYLLKATKIYAVQATVEVEQETQDALGGKGFGATDLKTLEMLKTIESTINGESFALRVIKQAHLDEDLTWTPARALPYHDDELVLYMQKKARAELERGTRLINIRVEDSEPERAVTIAHAFLRECALSSTETDNAMLSETRASLAKELEAGRTKLESTNLDIKQFRADHPTMQFDETPSDLKANPVDTRVMALNSAQLAAREEVLKLTNGVAQVRQARTGGLDELLKISLIANAEEINDLQKIYSEKTSIFSKEEARHLPKHPTYQSALKELRSVEEKLLLAARRRAAAMENTLAVALETEAKLAHELVTAQDDAREYQKVAAEFSRLADMHKNHRAHLNTIETRLKQAELNQNFGGHLLRIKGTPIQPTWPIKPSKRLVLLGAGVSGVALGIGLVLLLYFLDRSVRNLEQGEQLFGLPGLAVVPAMEARHPMDRLLNSPFTTSETAEAFRAMRTSLSFVGKGVLNRSILFTSPCAGDGKSYCAANYAITLAQQGYRTLLIDADLRQPTLDLILLGKRNPAGLISHLSGATESAQANACGPTPIPHLYLFSAGSPGAGHPAELLSSQAFHELIQDALKWFHRVVIDTPPVNAVTDALLLAREVDAVALVVRAAQTSRAEVTHAIRKLTAAGGRPVGFVLNAADPSALTKGYPGALNHAQPSSLTPALLRPASPLS